MKVRKISNEATTKARRGGSRDAIVEAAEGLILETGFGSVSMDELAEAAGVARRTLYNQFSSKEEIFREMLLRVSHQLEHAFPRGVETQGDVEDVLRLIARVILELHKNPEYLGFLRMVVADFPPISLDRRGVRRHHELANRAAHAPSRPSHVHGHPRLPQSAAGGSSVYGGPQRVLTVAMDDGSRQRARPSRGCGRGDDPDVPAALPAPVIKVIKEQWSRRDAEERDVGFLRGPADGASAADVPGRELALARMRAGWDRNLTWDCFVASLWQRQDGGRRLVAVNYAGNQSQCYVRLPLPDLGTRSVSFQDLMGTARHDRDGNDLLARGLYLDLPPWGYHVFDITTVSRS